MTETVYNFLFVLDFEHCFVFRASNLQPSAVYMILS